MAQSRRTAQPGLDLIKTFEGFRETSERLPDGGWVIGYGHTKSAREGLRIEQREALAILREYDLPPVERAVADLILAPLSQNEFDALVSFVYNIGIDAFEDSDVLEELNSGNRLAAANAIDAWRKARIGARLTVVDALVRRRAAEKALFLTDAGFEPVASSRRFRPEADALMSTSARFERAIRFHLSAPEPKSETESPAQAAARHVSARLTRILNEPDPETDHETGEADTTADIKVHVSERADPETEVTRPDETADAEDSMAEPDTADTVIIEADGDEDMFAPEWQEDAADAPVELASKDEADDHAHTPAGAALVEAGETLPDAASVEVVDAASADEETQPQAQGFGLGEALVANENNGGETDVVAIDEDAAAPQDEDEQEDPISLDEFSKSLSPPIEVAVDDDPEPRVVIDDFVDDQAPDETAEDETPPRNGSRGGRRGSEIGVFAILSILGLVFAGIGVSQQTGVLAVGEAVPSELAAYLPAFLILVGSLLFLIMAYYCVRSILSYED